jgi:hypothetical protein
VNASAPHFGAYRPRGDGHFASTSLTRGPWDHGHQHAGPPSALVCGAIERAAAAHGFDHVARLTVNLLRPVPISDVSVEVATDYVGRNVGHFSARLLSGAKEVARFTAAAQRLAAVPIPPDLPGHPLPVAPRPPSESPATTFPYAGRHHPSYFDLVELRAARGEPCRGPCAIWFRCAHPIVEGETPSAYQRVAVAADSGNGISAILDFSRYLFVNSDLTINLFRRPVGEWICIDARTLVGPDGCGLAESTILDEAGLVGRGTQSLVVRLRRPADAG